MFKCNKCGEVLHYTNEVIFDGDELKTVNEKYPDWSEAMCVTCFYEEEPT